SVCVDCYCPYIFFFFFQAEDGIRDRNVTGVQTCALPICTGSSESPVTPSRGPSPEEITRPELPTCGMSGWMIAWRPPTAWITTEIGRASCRERVEIRGGGVVMKTKRVKKSGKKEKIYCGT